MSTMEVEDPVDHQQRIDRLLRWRRVFRFLLLAGFPIAVVFMLGDFDQIEVLRSFVKKFDGVSNQVQQLADQFMMFGLELILIGGFSFLIGGASSPVILLLSWGRFLISWSLAALSAFFIALAFELLKYGYPVKPPSFPVVCTFAVITISGTWYGATWMRSRGGIRWFFSQLSLTFVLFSALILVISQTAFSKEPLEIQTLRVDSDTRRRLVYRLKEFDPKAVPENETATLTFSETELNQFLNWGLSEIPLKATGELRLEDGRTELKASLKLPENPIVASHLNLITSGKFSVHEGEIGYRADRFELGKISFPSHLLKQCGPALIESHWNAPIVDGLFRSVDKVDIQEDQLQVTYGFIDVDRESLLKAIIQLGLLDDFEEAVGIHVKNLIQLSESKENFTFGNCVEVVFVEAEKRSEKGDAVKENRAAIIALGYVLGHRKFSLLFGDDVPELSREALKKFRRIQLRGRQDWTRHFAVSAALQVLANSALSMDVGILKEELDADGGSGFSFGDILADRSGTTFAMKATESLPAAIAFQRKIRSELKESDIIPQGRDLPEGLTDSEFQKKFGGVGGKEYKTLIAEIDKRISQCSAYQMEEESQQ